MQGLYDVVSSEDLKGLTADDLQLLLSGKAEPVSCEQLRSISTFEDARGNALRSTEPEHLARFESLFWETVESMDESERLKVVEMATGSLVRTRACQTAPNLLVSEAARLAVPYLHVSWSLSYLDVQVAPPKLTIKLTECTNSAQAAYAQVCPSVVHPLTHFAIAADLQSPTRVTKNLRIASNPCHGMPRAHNESNINDLMAYIRQHG